MHELRDDVISNHGKAERDVVEVEEAIAPSGGDHGHQTAAADAHDVPQPAPHREEAEGEAELDEEVDERGEDVCVCGEEVVCVV